MKLALVSDLHFGVHRNSETHLKSQQRFFYEQFIPYIQENNIETVIVPGDVFDSRNSINVKIIYEVHKLFSTLNDICQTYVIVGNHDLYYTTNSDVHSLKMLEQFKNVRVVEENKKVKIDNIDVYMVPWIVDESSFVKSISKVKADICIGHFEITGFKMNKYKVNELGLNPKIFSHFKKVFSGHFHLKGTQKHKGAEITYVGSPYAMDRGDTNESKGFIVLDTETLEHEQVNNEVSLKYVKIEYPEPIVEDRIKGNVVDVYVNYDENYKEKDFQKYIEQIQKFDPIGNVNVKIVNNFLSGEEISNLEDFQNSSVEHMIDEYVGGLKLENEQDVMDILNGLFEEVK